MTSRTEMLSGQITMIRDIAEKIKMFAPDSKVLVISNPVDVLTYVFLKETGFPRERVIGVASSLDSSRFRFLLAKQLKTKSAEIKNAMVLGEHGDSMVPIFSIASCNDKSVLEMLNHTQIEKITKDLRDYWKNLRKLKGPSIFGISKNTVDIMKAIIKDKELSVPASVLLNGEYGFSDVCLGVPVRINKKGVAKIQEINLSESEQESLNQSAHVVSKYLLKETC
jgi:malate dehydrogenase